MTKILEQINAVVWGVPAIVLIIGVGFWLTIRTGFLQIRLFPKALQLFVQRMRGKTASQNGVSSYQALCTALAATVGTGNLAGVAGAIAIGGPGAVFWMWICALLGMIIKYAEATLAVRYRVRNEHAEYVGGPMYMIQQGLGKKYQWLAIAYCSFGVIAAFGVGNATQINAVIGAVNSTVLLLGGTSAPHMDLLLGIGFAVLIGLILSGGAQRIGKMAERLVPFAAVLYLLLGLGVLIYRYDAVPGAFRAIFAGAFDPQAVTGGVIGSAFQALRVGASRGTFTNEAGMGTASIAHAAAEVSDPAEQGLMGIMEVFLDTIVICTMTALVILCSGIHVDYGMDAGVDLTVRAFSSVYGHWIGIVLTVALSSFAIATILGWGLYGLRCAQFLFGHKISKMITAVQMIMVVLGAVLNTGTVWLLSETLNGLMVVPNLIALAMLSPQLLLLTKRFKDKMSSNAAGGTYENFHQCKPVRAFSHEKVPSSCVKGNKGGQEDLSLKHRTAGS